MGLENISQILADRAKVAQNHDARKVASATLSLKMKWGYISADKLNTERAFLLPVYISVKNQFIRS